MPDMHLQRKGSSKEPKRDQNRWGLALYRSRLLSRGRGMIERPRAPDSKKDPQKNEFPNLLVPLAA